MDILALVSKFGIYAIFAFTLSAAVLTVTVRNIFHAALTLAFSLLGVAAVYFVLRAEFLGAVQILLYVGAVMVLIIFAVMMTTRVGEKTPPISNRQRYPVLFGVLILGYLLIRTLLQTDWNLKETLTTIDAVHIGKLFMGAYIFPFELVSVILVAALIGAIVIARGDES